MTADGAPKDVPENVPENGPEAHGGSGTGSVKATLAKASAPSRRRTDPALAEASPSAGVAEPEAAPASGIDIAMADLRGLEEVVDREALRDICHSFFDLFNLNIRVFGADGTLLADAHEEAEIHGYLRTVPSARAALAKDVDAVQRLVPRKTEARHTEITGAVYDVVPLVYQGRAVGRFVLGPYLPAEMREVPAALLALGGLDRERVRDLLTAMPRVREPTAKRIRAHLRRVVDLLLFASHRAHLTSEMHVASVRSSYRELAEKTAKLQSAYDRLKELDRLKSNFLATVSHELRTPLTSIIGYSEMLETGIAGELNAEQRDFVATIHNKGDQLLQLISSLLDLSKLEQGVMTLRRERLDAGAVLAEVAKTMVPAAHRKGITLETQRAEDLPFVDADPIRLRQVLSNLAENALKFTPEGGRVRFIATTSEFEPEGGDALGAVLMAAPERAVALVVEDSGIGMPERELARIFDAFYQVDSSSTREHGGTGLGLSIVKRLVDAHAGHVRVESTPGQGTRFTVLLPEAGSEVGLGGV
ncbi:MAG: ATP-binding protein [Myxococcota bacterium]